jgi:pyruvate/2-oxoglutarate dehydrogenase complex dihydrolipoamide dehydrogenase (E3) component
MTESLDADVVVIGMGPGGEDVAGRLAEEGLDVVGVESRLLGGECPYWGCVPSKMMVRAAGLLEEARRIPGMAGSAEVHPDWAPVAQRIRDEATDDWDDRVAVERYEGKGGVFVRGAGRITASGRVEVKVDGDGDGGPDVVVNTRRGIVVASGSRPFIPPIPGLDAVPYWTNRNAIEVVDLPPSLLVLGGGAIGVELAQVFARFGVAVTVVEVARWLVAAEEPEACQQLSKVFAREGIAVHTGASVTKVTGDDREIALEMDDGSTLTAARLLVATGRHADLAAVGLGAVGVDEGQRVVPVDDHMRVTGADGVWAVGDITGKGNFTHVAVYQAPIAVASILGRDHVPADYRALPRVTFTDPEIGSVGMTEAQARDAGLPVRTGTAQVPSVARGWIHKAGNDGFIKLVEDSDAGVLVGATAMAPAGGEILGLLSLAVHAQVPVETLRSMIYAYPTFHRGIEDALHDLDS